MPDDLLELRSEHAIGSYPSTAKETMTQKNHGLARILTPRRQNGLVKKGLRFVPGVCQPRLRNGWKS